MSGPADRLRRRCEAGLVELQPCHCHTCALCRVQPRVSTHHHHYFITEFYYKLTKCKVYYYYNYYYYCFYLKLESEVQWLLFMHYYLYRRGTSLQRTVNTLVNPDYNYLVLYQHHYTIINVISRSKHFRR